MQLITLNEDMRDVQADMFVMPWSFEGVPRLSSWNRHTKYLDVPRCFERKFGALVQLVDKFIDFKLLEVGTAQYVRYPNWPSGVKWVSVWPWEAPGRNPLPLISQYASDLRESCPRDVQSVVLPNFMVRDGRYQDTAFSERGYLNKVNLIECLTEQLSETDLTIYVTEFQSLPDPGRERVGLT